MSWTVEASRLLCATRMLGSVVAVVLLASSFGCATSQPAPSDFASNRVSESVAKRDLGIDYLSSGRTAMAIRELRASLQLDATDPSTHLWLGEAYRRKGKTEESEALLLSGRRPVRSRTSPDRSACGSAQPFGTSHSTWTLRGISTAL